MPLHRQISLRLEETVGKEGQGKMQKRACTSEEQRLEILCVGMNVSMNMRQRERGRGFR